MSMISLCCLNLSQVHCCEIYSKKSFINYLLITELSKVMMIHENLNSSENVVRILLKYILVN